MANKKIISSLIIAGSLYYIYKNLKKAPMKPKSGVFGGSNMCSVRSLSSRNTINVETQKIIQSSIKSFGSLTVEQQTNIKLIIDAFKKHGDCDNAKLAYILATAWHESRFSPLREGFAKNDASARLHVKNKAYGKVVNGQVYYGRGFSQLTWDFNYKTFGQLLGVDLYNNPDLAMIPKYAAEIIVVGMMEGKFTTKKLGNYITDASWDFYNARRTVNSLDKAGKIKGYAESLIS